MNHISEFTAITSKALDSLGYSPRMVKRRQEAYNNHSIAMTLLHRKMNIPFLSVTITGSKREGLSGPLQSDIDMMTSWNNVIATRDITTLQPESKIVFKLEDEDSPAGYTKLKLIRRQYTSDPSLDLINFGLFHDTPQILCLSSRFFMSTLENTNVGQNNCWRTIDKQTRHGPSLSKTITNSVSGLTFSIDDVTAAPCYCPDILQLWIDRPRSFGWPSQTIIDQIAISEVHVVPVGAKIADDEFALWRICCTHAEIILMKYLNETQWKLYVLLKMLKSAFLESISDGITSYLMKNILLWVVEKHPIENFQVSNLLDMFFHCISFLRHCVHEKFVPSYMIPSRNLLLGKLNPHQHKQILYKLDDILKSSIAVLLMIPELQKPIVDSFTQPDVVKFNMTSMDNAEEINLTEHFMPLTQQADRLKQMLSSTIEDEFLKCQLPLTRLKSFKARYARLCHTINLKSENGFKLSFQKLVKVLNVPQLIGNASQTIKQGDTVARALVDIATMLESEYKDQLYETFIRIGNVLAHNDVVMDILNATIDDPFNWQNLCDFVSALCEICPSTVQIAFKTLFESPLFRQSIVSISIILHNKSLTLPIDHNAILRVWQNPQCASDFKGPYSTFADILSRK